MMQKTAVAEVSPGTEAFPERYLVVAMDTPSFFRVVSANEAVLDAMGKSREEIEGQDVFQLLSDVTKNADALRIQELIDLNRSKDEFISIASHQLRTPATAVKQYIGMLLEGLEGDLTILQQKMLQKAYDNNERQLNTISDLLRVAQVDAGYISLSKEKVNINAMIEKILAELAVVFEERQQHVVFRPDKKHHTAYVDKQTFSMVLENLIDNASKYSQNGTTIEVSVTFGRRDIAIKVSDQGVGIDRKEYKQLFGKFSRIPNELSTERGGTGLGLYWAKRIIDMHDGTIKVRSKKDVGTTFTATIPK